MEVQNWYICEVYPHPINEMRFGSPDSALVYARKYYGLKDGELFANNGMGYFFWDKDGNKKGFRILLDK